MNNFKLTNKNLRYSATKTSADKMPERYNFSQAFWCVIKFAETTFFPFIRINDLEKKYQLNTNIW